MRAILITESGGPDVLKLEETSSPDPAPDELLVDVEAFALNRADLLQRRGEYPSPEGTRSDIPGLEFAGTVARPAETDENFSEGDRVFGLLAGAGYAERVTVPANHAMGVPDPLDFEEAAAVPEVFVTSYDALVRQGNLGLGDTCLIHAAGSGVGTAVLQLADLVGASTIFGTASRPKLERIEELGFRLDEPINYEEESFGERVSTVTNGEGVDLILDVIGAPYWEENVRSLRPEGRIILLGLLGGDSVEADLKSLLLNRARVYGSTLRMRTDREKAKLIESFVDEVLPHFERGALQPVVDRVMSWTGIAEAHRIMENNENTGKIVLRVD